MRLNDDGPQLPLVALTPLSSALSLFRQSVFVNVD